MTSRWPWVSRARLDDAVESARVRLGDAMEQVDQLRAQVAGLTDALTRISRREAGLPETPRVPRPPAEPMPEDVRRYIQEAGDERIRRMMMATVFGKRATGVSWERILQEIKREAIEL